MTTGKEKKIGEYPQISPNEWVQPVRKGYRMMCCDCGLVHELDFRIVKDMRGRNRIQFRARRCLSWKKKQPNKEK